MSSQNPLFLHVFGFKKIENYKRKKPYQNKEDNEGHPKRHSQYKGFYRICKKPVAGLNQYNDAKDNEKDYPPHLSAGGSSWSEDRNPITIFFLFVTHCKPPFIFVTF